MKGELPTYATVVLEICNMPFNALGDFLGQLALRHWLRRDLVILGGELSHVR